MLIYISSAQSQSVPPVWVDAEYGYYSQNKALAEVISDFAAELKLPVMISPAVSGVVNGDFPTMKAIDFLSMLARVHRLMWFYDGAVLHIYNTKEIQEKIIPLPTGQATDLEQAFKELNVIGTHYYWKIISKQSLIELSGPPRFMDLAHKVIGSATEPPSSTFTNLPSLDDHVVKIFKLKYIYAFGDSKQKTIDIAQLLGRIMNVGYYVTEGDRDASQKMSPSGKLLGSGLSPSFGGEANAEKVESPPEKTPLQSTDPNAAYIIVDTRLNMLIVRDVADRIPLYEAMIEQLDKPLDQIEIEVLILDINDDETKNLGIEWNYESGDFAYSQGGFSITEMTAAESHSFRIRLEALTTQGRAQVSARPSVLTLDNHEAEFSSQETFYVKLGAQSAESQAVDLVPITYGASLKVKPHVIYKDNNEHEILLTLDLEDGRRSNNSREVNGVPSITNSKIKTQAMVSNGKSLLIGGYKVEHESVGIRGVPLLSFLPVVGLFFRVQNMVDLDTRRYFLISPKLVQSEVVFQSNVDGSEVLQRDMQSHEDRYPRSSEDQKISQPKNPPPQSHNLFYRSHSGPP